MTIVILIFLLTSSCRSRKIGVTTSDIRTTSQVVTKMNPYKLESIDSLRVGSKGKIINATVKLNIGETTSRVVIKNNLMTTTLENKDTVITNTVSLIKQIKTTDTVIEKVKLSFWGKLKKKINTFAIYILIFNILFVAYKVTRWIYKIRTPI